MSLETQDIKVSYLNIVLTQPAFTEAMNGWFFESVAVNKLCTKKYPYFSAIVISHKQTKANNPLSSGMVYRAIRSRHCLVKVQFISKALCQTEWQQQRSNKARGHWPVSPARCSTGTKKEPETGPKHLRRRGATDPLCLASLTLA